jgi:hypothetical protein
VPPIVLQSPPDTLLQQLMPLVAPITGALGVVAGVVLTSRRQEATAIKTQARETYARFVVACHDLARAANEVFEASEVEIPYVHERLREVVYVLRLGESEIQFFGHEALRAKARTLARLALTISDGLVDAEKIDHARTASGGEVMNWQPVQEFEAELAAFIPAARKAGKPDS